MTTSTVICDASQTPADFTTNLFSRQREDTFHMSSNANNVYPSGAEEAMLRLKSQQSSRSLQTISSTKSSDKKPVYDLKGSKRQSNLSYSSNIIVDSNVTDEPQSLYGNSYEGTKSSLYENDDIGFLKVVST